MRRTLKPKILNLIELEDDSCSSTLAMNSQDQDEINQNKIRFSATKNISEIIRIYRETIHVKSQEDISSVNNKVEEWLECIHHSNMKQPESILLEKTTENQVQKKLNISLNTLIN